MLKYALFFFYILFLENSFSQNNTLSSTAEISLITSGPGKNLHEKFGHTAIRVKDFKSNIDNIYNYGIFDFDAPNFILNFTKGRLIYKLAKYPFHYDLRAANEDKRWVKEQILNLTLEEKQRFYTFLENNAKPKNANYEYDPFLNNCATKPRDIIKSIIGTNFNYSDKFVKEDQSFRQLMNKEIYWNTWGSFGINLALGSKLDKILSHEEYMYLPDYLYTSLSTSRRPNSDENIIVKSNTLLKFKEKVASSDTISPFLVFFILLVIGIIITALDARANKRTKWFDFTLFFVTGVIGLLIVFLWFFTNHTMTPNNFNFLWAFFPNLFIGFFLLKTTQKKWLKKYVLVLIVLLLVIPVIWISGVQLFNWAMLPLFSLLLIRYSFLYKTLNS